MIFSILFSNKAFINLFSTLLLIKANKLIVKNKKN